MRDTIFIPKVINIGYQNRNDTFTGKLAYVVYTDEKGTLRKQASWDSWRDKDIEPDTFDNTPTSGFVLNKKVGDTKSHWNFRQAYCRVYDPRGFEFEIAFENLLYILENTNSIVGKGLDGAFVYGWDGKELVLLPTCSPDYKEIEEYTKAMYSDTVIKGKDLVMGYTYKGKDGALYMYLGKYLTYSKIYHYNEPSLDIGNHFWFAKFDDVQSLNSFDINELQRNYSVHMICRKSIPAKFLISIYDSNVSPYLSDCVNYIDGTQELSPIDKDSIKVKFFTEEEWEDYIQQLMNHPSWWYELPFCSKPHNNMADNYCLICRNSSTEEIPKAVICKVSNTIYGSRTELETVTLDKDTIKRIRKQYMPCYIDINLQNGRPYKREYKWLPL